MTDRNANVVLTANTQQYSQQLSSAQQQTNQLTQSVTALTSAINNISRNSGRKIEILGAAGLASMAAATASAAKLEQRLSQINATAQLTGRSMSSYSRQLDQLRRGMAVTTDGAIALFTQLNKLGQSSASLKALSETMVRLSAVTGESIGGLTQGLISLQRAMNVTGTEYTQRFASSLANVSAKAGVSAQGVLEFSNAIAPIARVAGISTQEVLGFSAAFVKSGQDGFAAANAFNKMLTDITRSIQYGSSDLKAYANLLGVTTDQFRNMPKSEAITQIFETISKQGPDAIKTLERFGLDGIRTVRAIQGVAGQSGGIRGAIADAIGGFSNTSNFQKASDVALQGFNDQLQILRNNLTATAQAAGAAFLPMLTKMTQGLNSIVRTVGMVLEPVTQLGAALGALGSVGAIGIGLLISNFTRLAAVAGVVQLARSLPVRGFMAGFRGGAGPEAATFNSGGGTGLQRALFSSGMWAGNALGSFRGSMAGSGPGLLSRASTAGGWLVGQVGNFARFGLEPLYGSRLYNSFNRSSPFGAGIDQFRANMGGAMSAGQGAWAGARVGGSGLLSSASQAASAARAALAMNSLASSTTAQRGLFAALGAETGKLIVSMARASAGLAMGVGMGAARVGMRGLGALGAGAMSLAGGPAGLAIMGGLGATYLVSANRNTGQEIRETDETRAAGNSYRVALGEAAIATRTFAQVVNSSSSAVASDVTKGYTDKNVQAFKTPQEAAAFFAASGNLMSDKGRNLFQNDLAKRFGSAEANKILAGGSSAVDFGGIFGEIRGQKLFGPLAQSFKTTEQTKRVASNARNALAQQLGAASSPQDANRAVVAAINAARQAYNGPGAEERSRAAIIDSLIGGMGLANTEQNRRLIRNMLSASSPQQINNALQGMDLNGSNRIESSLAGSEAATALGSAYRGVGSGFDINSTRFTPTPSPATTAQGGMFSLLQGTMAGRVLGRGGGVTNAVQQFMGNQANLDYQYTASQGLARAMTQAAGTTTKAIYELEKMASTIGDTTDPLYQLAMAAAQAARNTRSRETLGIGSAGMAGLAVQDLNNAIALPQDATGVRSTAIGNAQANLDQQRQAAYQRFVSIIQATRELNIQISRGWEDFNRNRARAEQDYNISRFRQERNFNIQRKQAVEDFNLSRKRAEQDFNHSVQVMARQTARSVYDIYQRVTVQQSWSGTNLAANMADQQQRLAQQQSDLAKLRKLGISGDVISMLGLNESQNAQQLARFVQDVMESPELIKRFNDMAKKRIEYGEKIVTDKDSEQWKEMQRSFRLSQERATEDFNRGMRRQQEQFARALGEMRADFARSMERQVADMNTQMGRARADLNRSAEEITGSFNQIAKRAIDTLSGTAREQMDELYRQLKAGQKRINTVINNINDKLDGISAGPGGNIFDGGGGTPNLPSGGGSTAANRALGKKILNQFGWGSYWTSFDKLVMGESGWRNTAQNPTSTAYGIGQFLNSTWATVGGTKTSDPSKQIYYMLKYIKQRYGNPANAYSKWLSRSPHWYKDGALFDKPTVIGVGEKGKEAVFPLNQRGVDFMMAVMKQYNTEARNATVAGRNPQAMSGSVYNMRADYSTSITGPITVQAQDPDEMLRKIEARKRRDRLVAPR